MHALIPAVSPGLRRGLAIAGLCTSLFGCGPRDPRATLSLATLDPVASGRGLTYVQTDRARALVLDLSGDSVASVRHVSVGAQPIQALARPGADEVLVLSRGVPAGSTRATAIPPQLTVIPTGSGAGTPRTYALGSPFNALSVTDDGRTAMVYFSSRIASNGLLFNPNEIAFVQLSSPDVQTAISRRTLRSFGGVPDRVVFSPAYSIRGESRPLAVVLSAAYLTILDLAHLDRTETTVRLTLPEDARSVTPEQVLFDAPGKAFYVRAAASNDIYVIRLDDSGTAPTATGNDFRVTVNQVGAGRGPSDLALFGAGASQRLLVVSAGSREVRVVDTQSDAVTTLGLDADADRILLFEGTAPRDTARRPRALLYASGTTLSASAVTFVDLEDVAARGAQNLETVQLGRRVVGALSLPARGAVMFEHAGDGARSQLNLLDLQTRSASPIYVESSLFGARTSADGNTLWITPDAQRTTSATARTIGYVDLRDFHPGELVLDAATSALVPFGSGGRIAAVHVDGTGYVTVFDGARPSRQTAWSFRGFLLTDVFAEEAP